jgi:N-acetyl-anhydromuramyl-L-alanine amidase AmpD
VRGEGLMLGTISNDAQNLQLALAKYGCSVPVTGKYDGPTMEVVTAFQRHPPGARRRHRRSFDADHAAYAVDEFAGGCGEGGEVAAFPHRRLS